MSYLRVNVDPNAVTYSDYFIYSIDVSFNGLYGPLKPVLLKTIIPDTIEYIKPTVLSPVKNVTTEEVKGGTEITFDFGTINDTGMATTLSLKCRYKLSAPDTSSFMLDARLYINDVNTPYLTATGPAVFLSITPYYTLTLNTVVPNSTTAASGGSVIYEATLENVGEQWKDLSNYFFRIDFEETPYLTLDSSFSIVGKDISTSRYKDTRANGITAELFPNENGFTFSIPNYRGEKYHFYFRALIDSNLLIGTVVTLTASWSIEGTPQTTAEDVFRIVEDDFSATTQITGPLQVQPGNYIKYTSRSSNTGNQDLKNVSIRYELPVNKLQSFRLKTGVFGIEPIDIPLEQDYLITYTTRGENPTEYPLVSNGHPEGYYNASTSSTLLLQDIIPSDANVQYVTWYIGDFPVGASNLAPLSLEAYTADNLQLGTEILMHTNTYWDGPDGNQMRASNNFSTPVSLLSELYILNHTVSPRGDAIPGDILTFSSTVNAVYSQLNEPILLQFIPSELTLETSGEDLIDALYFEYYNGITNTTINSIDNKDSFPFPSAELIENYNNTGEYLLRLSYTDDNTYFFPQGSWLKYRFKAKVNIGAIGTFTSRSILANNGPYGAVSGAIDTYTEVNAEDIDNDNIYNEQLAVSNTISIRILEHVSIETSKLTRGASDTNFTKWPSIASSFPGGVVQYRLSILNSGNKPINSVELVDIIPHIGDTGVIIENQPRGSEFPVYQVTRLEVSLIDIDGNPVTPVPTIEVLYSRSFDPVRFGSSGDLIGSVDDWSTSPPDPITDIGAYKVITSNQAISPGETLIIDIACLIPSGVTVGEVAWNSFAILADYYDANGALKQLLPVEPKKAGVSIINQDGTSTLSGRVWFDNNKDGLYSPSERGVDDVGILLYKVEGDEGRLIATTITTPNTLGEHGHFIFSGLEPGSYTLRFAPDFYHYAFTSQDLTSALGSKVNPSTGYTPIFILESDMAINDILVGLIDFRTLDFILSINASANQTVRSTIYSQMLLNSKLEEVMKLL